MKQIIFTIVSICISSLAFAGTISLPPGSSYKVDRNTTVTCEDRGSVTPALRTYNCLCYNTGRTDNPAPIRIQVESKNSTEAMIDGRSTCSTLNYGRPDFGFSPVNNCHLAEY